MKTKFIVLVIFHFLLAANIIYAEDEKKEVNENEESQVENIVSANFGMLREKRTRLTTAIPKIRDELAKLEEKSKRLPLLEEVKRALKNTEARLVKEKKKKKLDNKKIESLEEDLIYIKQDLEKLLTLDPKLKNLKRELNQKQEELGQVESKINDLLNRDIVEQTFKREVTLVFGGLVGLVIVGFFWVAAVDADVRKSIFGGGAGIQFLTLFSLVIAIILFGITSILEAKELSALLGGLSGYILGRGIGKTTDEQPGTT